MTTRSTTFEFDIARNQWAAFLHEFSSDHRSWLTTIERCDDSGSTEILARDVPLASVTADPAAGAAQRIRITFSAGEQEDAGVVEIADAVALRLVEPPGRVPLLEIHHRNGRCTRVRFRDVPLPELLDGVAPGEVEPLPPV